MNSELVVKVRVEPGDLVTAALFNDIIDGVNRVGTDLRRKDDANLSLPSLAVGVAAAAVASKRRVSRRSMLGLTGWA